MKKYLLITTSILLLAVACNKQVQVKPVQNQSAQIKSAVETELAKPETPTGSRLISIKVDGNKITLDFSKQIESKGQAIFEDTFHRISNAIININEAITEYQILIEGQSLNEYYQSQETANWKTYTSARLGLTFKYPADWGIPKEEYWDNTSCNPNDPNVKFCGGVGKTLIIYFSNDLDRDKYPVISVGSVDSGPYEGPSNYTGNVSIEDYYNKLVSSPYGYKGKANYMLLDNKVRALSTITSDVRYGGGIQLLRMNLIAKLTNTDLSGLDIQLDLIPWVFYESIQKRFGFTAYQERETVEKILSEHKQLIQKIENGTADKVIQDKSNQFKTFVQTFKFTK